MLGSEWVFGLIFVVLFYGAGKREAQFGGEDHSLLWAVLSIALSAWWCWCSRARPPTCSSRRSACSSESRRARLARQHGYRLFAWR